MTVDTIWLTMPVVGLEDFLSRYFTPPEAEVWAEGDTHRAAILKNIQDGKLAYPRSTLNFLRAYLRDLPMRSYLKFLGFGDAALALNEGSTQLLYAPYWIIDEKANGDEPFAYELNVPLGRMTFYGLRTDDGKNRYSVQVQIELGSVLNRHNGKMLTPETAALALRTYLTCLHHTFPFIDVREPTLERLDFFYQWFVVGLRDRLPRFEQQLITDFDRVTIERRLGSVWVDVRPDVIARFYNKTKQMATKAPHKYPLDPPEGGWDTGWIDRLGAFCRAVEARAHDVDAVVEVPLENVPIDEVNGDFSAGDAEDDADGLDEPVDEVLDGWDDLPSEVFLPSTQELLRRWLEAPEATRQEMAATFPSEDPLTRLRWKPRRYEIPELGSVLRYELSLRDSEARASGVFQAKYLWDEDDWHKTFSGQRMVESLQEVFPGYVMGPAANYTEILAEGKLTRDKLLAVVTHMCPALGTVLGHAMGLKKQTRQQRLDLRTLLSKASAIPIRGYDQTELRVPSYEDIREQYGDYDMAWFFDVIKPNGEYLEWQQTDAFAGGSNVPWFEVAKGAVPTEWVWGMPTPQEGGEPEVAGTEVDPVP